MRYLEYHKGTKQVVEIHVSAPEVKEQYDFATSEIFGIGDEFEQTIWVNEVDENKNLISYSAIRNNPNATRLLKENEMLKAENEKLKIEDLNNKDAIAELYIMTIGGV